MAYEKLHMLPLILIFLIPTTLFVTYKISLQLNHVVGFPYISETGRLSPESCIFTQFLNIAALLLGICVYIKHRQTEQWVIERAPNSIRQELLYFTFGCGILACIGLEILANFQTSRVVTVHIVGALICFIASTLYFCLQSYISYKMIYVINGWTVIMVRIVLSFFMLVSTATTIIPGYWILQNSPGEYYKNWRPSDSKWDWHVTSVLSEWLLVMIYCAFIFTFVSEFRYISLQPPVINLIYKDRWKNNELPEIEMTTVTV